VSERSATVALSREVKFLGNPLEELLRRLRDHIRHDESEGVVGSGFDRCEEERNVRRLSQSSPVDARHAPPESGSCALRTDAWVVLKEEPDALVFMRELNISE
jgi:hypothetical protein